MHTDDTAQADIFEDIVRHDAEGFFVAPGETLQEFCSRKAVFEKNMQKLSADLKKNGETVLFDEFTVKNSLRIQQNILAEGGDITSKLYGFRITGIPGFFLSEHIGLLWGGCLVSDPAYPLPVMLLRRAFCCKDKFLIYRRRELLAHELCHAARIHLHDNVLEEFFAYQTAASGLRRYLGNCFRRESDALIFALPALLLLAAQAIQQLWLPALPAAWFWYPALLCPGWLLLVNQLSRRKYFKAAGKLQKWGIAEPQALLFRTTHRELCEIGALSDKAEFKNYITDKCGELRWQVIRRRFIPEEVFL